MLQFIVSYYASDLVMLKSVFRKTSLREEIFGEEILMEDIFVEIIFIILPQSHKIKFLGFFLIEGNRKNKFYKKSLFVRL